LQENKHKHKIQLKDDSAVQLSWHWCAWPLHWLASFSADNNKQGICRVSKISALTLF